MKHLSDQLGIVEVLFVLMIAVTIIAAILTVLWGASVAIETLAAWISRKANEWRAR